ncbi:MAG: LysM peptidoglycan-binding domain-containing protein [Actinomycetota bacterium]|nr:LysM peptidoglycan-binding domain-containing protein [Actinomycetota bacterium]
MTVHNTHAHGPNSLVTPLEVFLIMAAVAVAFALMASSVESQPACATATRSIRVQASQTLWDLAQANPIEGHSTVETVEYIRALNQMETSAIQVGQMIDVPDSGVATAMVAR